MQRTVVKNATVVLPDRLAENHAVVFDKAKIHTVCATEEVAYLSSDIIIDAHGDYLAPGFIDLHIHGTHQFRIDFGPSDLAHISSILPTYGVTGFLPTVCPRPKGKDSEFLNSLSKVTTQGANILGFHMEGPFIAMTGAMPKSAIGTADRDRVIALIEAARPYPAIFSIAPDLPDILSLLTIMRANGLPVFMTHTAANVKQTQDAINAGARHATHFYDVFLYPPESEPGVRSCGAVEAILADPRVTVDFILDGEHVDPVAVEMCIECKGSESVCLITDANLGAGLPPGKYKTTVGEVEFAYRGGPARQTENAPNPGCLAGSGLTMSQAVRNAVDMVGVSLVQAVRMASANPATVLGLDKMKGKVVQGFQADLILLDSQLRVIKTWVCGECVFSEKKDQ